MARVALQNVIKLYPGVQKPAVDSVTVEVKDLEFLVLVGPSGCGKSTTLRLVAGLEKAVSGDIFIGERRVNDVRPKDRDIAMIFQNYALYPHMTAYQNLAFPLKMRKFPKPEIDRRVREAAEMLGITELLDRKPKALSGGQRQRVAVGRAIVRKPQVFLFDEPLSNLDAKMRVVMRAEIAKLHRRLQTTMIYVTHDQIEAMTMGDRIVVMHEGKVQQMDNPKTIYDRPVNKFVAGFIGSPPMNFLSGELKSEGDDLRFESGPVRMKIPTQHRPALQERQSAKILLGIRPEDFSDQFPALPNNSWSEIQSEVEDIEPLGAEVILHVAAGTSRLTARLGPETQAHIGQPKNLWLNLAKAHFFDAETERRIG